MILTLLCIILCTGCVGNELGWQWHTDLPEPKHSYSHSLNSMSFWKNGQYLVHHRSCSEGDFVVLRDVAHGTTPWTAQLPEGSVHATYCDSQSGRFVAATRLPDASADGNRGETLRCSVDVVDPSSGESVFSRRLDELVFSVCLLDQCSTVAAYTQLAPSAAAAEVQAGREPVRQLGVSLYSIEENRLISRRPVSVSNDEILLPAPGNQLVIGATKYRLDQKQWTIDSDWYIFPPIDSFTLAPAGDRLYCGTTAGVGILLPAHGHLIEIDLDNENARRRIGCPVNWFRVRDSIQVAAGSQWIVSGEGRYIRFWDPETRREISRLECPRRIRRIALSEDERWLAAWIEEDDAHGRHRRNGFIRIFHLPA